MNHRKIETIVRGYDGIDGAGVHLRRVLGNQTIKQFDPFLMLDGFDSTNPADYVKGFPAHPHRGIETVTYLLQGRMEHRDSLGSHGVIGDGDCQWMTAGSGIIHEEMPEASERMMGCQLWINLPQKDKMVKPAYNSITKEQLPIVEKDGYVARILAGTFYETKGAMQGQYVDANYIDIDLKPGQTFSYDQIPSQDTAFIYLFEGTLIANGKEEDKGAAILFEKSVDNNVISITAGDKGARFALLSATPLNESVAWGGPIVMNTRAELMKAFEELENGTFEKEHA